MEWEVGEKKFGVGPAVGQSIVDQSCTSFLWLGRWPSLAWLLGVPARRFAHHTIVDGPAKVYCSHRSSAV